MASDGLTKPCSQGLIDLLLLNKLSFIKPADVPAKSKSQSESESLWEQVGICGLKKGTRQEASIGLAKSMGYRRLRFSSAVHLVEFDEQKVKFSWQQLNDEAAPDRPKLK